MAEFDIKAGGFKGRANLNIDLENMILSIADKFDENLLHEGSNHFKSGSELINMFFDMN